MFKSGLVDTLVTHANIKGFGLTPLSGDCRGYMSPLLKTKQRTNMICNIKSKRKAITTLKRITYILDKLKLWAKTISCQGHEIQNYRNNFSLKYNPILRIPLDYIVESSQRQWFIKTYSSDHFTSLFKFINLLMLGSEQLGYL